MTETVPTGQLVADRFLIVRFIAAGGMGEVYEAEDQALGDRVALKFLNRRSIGDEQVMRRFRREIQLARKVTHRNVCRLYDLYQHTPVSGLADSADSAFVTMELLSGDTLEDHLEAHGRMSEEQALPLVAQMAEALGAAHAAGIIHRDFKTSNVMLVPSEADATGVRVVVTDFGLARLAQPADDSKTPLTGEMRIVGTADYMSPEQLYGEHLTTASDIYSLGVVIFEMMTGHRPYQAQNPMSLLAKRVSEPPASPADFVPGLDEVWTRTILRCLDNDPAERFPTARDVIVALGGEDYIFTTQPSGSVTPPPGWVAEMKRRQKAKTSTTAKRSARAVAALIVAGLTLLGIWWSMARERPPATLSSFNPVQVTAAAGLELDPSFSPDGSAIAYSSDESGVFEIHLRDLTPGGREIQLTEGGSQCFEPAWSPDGSTIAYHSKDQGGIWTVPADGGSPARLTTFGSRPAWSPDGSWIAFQDESSPMLSDTTSPALSLSTLWIMRRDGSERRQVTRAGEPPGGHAAPAFSPDGRRLAFSTSPQRGASEIWSVALDGPEPTLLTREPAVAYDPAYADDGRSIFFTANSREVNALWQMPVSPRTGEPTGEPIQIANLGVASIRQPAVSADGSKVAYAAIKTVSDLWTLPLDPASATSAGRPWALTQGSGRNNRPALSPDGTQVAFDRWQHGSNITLWTMALNGDNSRQVTVDPWTHTQPSWFPSGDRLAYQSRRDGRRSLWTIDLGDGTQEQLAELADDVDWIKLSPDGTRLAYHSRSRDLGFNLWVMELADGSTRQLTFDAEFMGFPCWSQDGNWLAFQRKVGEDSHVMVLPSEGGEPRQLTFETGQNWPFSFAPDHDKVAFSALRDGEWNLWWVSRTTGVEQRLTLAPRLNAYVRYPAWSPAGDQIIYELAHTAGDLWVVETDTR